MMGSYGIGPARIARRRDRAARRRARDRLAARDRALAGPPRLARQGRRARARGRRQALRGAARRRASRSLYDDRDAGPGEKLTDAELLGCPLRIVVGRRGLADGVVEALRARRRRRARAAGRRGRRAGPMALLAALDCDLRCLTRPVRPRPRPPPLRARPQRARSRARPATGEPLHPWTIPNFGRLPAAGAAPGLPRPRLHHRRRPLGCLGDGLLGDRRRRLPRRLPRPR